MADDPARRAIDHVLKRSQQTPTHPHPNIARLLYRLCEFNYVDDLDEAIADTIGLDHLAHQPNQFLRAWAEDAAARLTNQ